MSILHHKTVTSYTSPAEALDELCSPFRGYANFGRCCEEVHPRDMPELARDLLVHNRHMTLVLKAHLGAPVDLYVMEVRREHDYYSRKIFLTPHGRAQPVELGVVRLDLRCLSAVAKSEILQGSTPLGAVLVKHNLLTRVQPQWYMRFAEGCPLLAWMGQPRGGPWYGRLGTIFCNDEPAIEVLEIVTIS